MRALRCRVLLAATSLYAQAAMSSCFSLNQAVPGSPAAAVIDVFGVSGVSGASAESGVPAGRWNRGDRVAWRGKARSGDWSNCSQCSVLG